MKTAWGVWLEDEPERLDDESLLKYAGELNGAVQVAWHAVGELHSEKFTDYERFLARGDVRELEELEDAFREVLAVLGERGLVLAGGR